MLTSSGAIWSMYYQASANTDCKGIFKDAQKEAREKIRNGEITRDNAK